MGYWAFQLMAVDVQLPSYVGHLPDFARSIYCMGQAIPNLGQRWRTVRTAEHVDIHFRILILRPGL